MSVRTSWRLSIGCFVTLASSCGGDNVSSDVATTDATEATSNVADSTAVATDSTGASTDATSNNDVSTGNCKLIVDKSGSSWKTPTCDAACEAAKTLRCAAGVAIGCHSTACFEHAEEGAKCRAQYEAAVCCYAQPGATCEGCEAASDAFRKCAWAPAEACKKGFCMVVTGQGGNQCMCDGDCRGHAIEMNCKELQCTCTVDGVEQFAKARSALKCADSDQLYAECMAIAEAMPIADGSCMSGKQCGGMQACVIAECGEKGVCAPGISCGPFGKHKVCGCDDKTHDQCSAFFLHNHGMKHAGPCK